MPPWLDSVLTQLALPQYGLSTLFVLAFISATLLPVGSELALLGLLQLNPSLLGPAVLVATLGNTLGGALTWWMGYGASHWVRRAPASAQHARALVWVQRFGPKTCLLAWLPLVGDPLCAVAGWLKLPFWQCLGYMAVGKLLRYASLAGAVAAL